MTRIQIKKIIKVLIAYADGKALQARPIGSKDSMWEDVTGDCDFHNPFWEFRVKPEPKLVPFTFEDAPLLRGKWIKNKAFLTTEDCILAICAGDVETKLTSIPYDILLEEYIFADTGEPCGKLIDGRSEEDIQKEKDNSFD